MPVGAEVRAHLTEAGLESLQFLPRRDPWQVEGALLRFDDELVLEVSLPADARVGSNRQLAQIVTLSREEFAGLDVKEPDHTRSALAIGGVGAVFTLVAIKILFGQIFNEVEEEPDLPESSVPVLRFR